MAGRLILCALAALLVASCQTEAKRCMPGEVQRSRLGGGDFPDGTGSYTVVYIKCTPTGRGRPGGH
jgi:hypothetical protein